MLRFANVIVLEGVKVPTAAWVLQMLYPRPKPFSVYEYNMLMQLNKLSLRGYTEYCKDYLTLIDKDFILKVLLRGKTVGVTTC